ncbi:MAG: hypothetical protein MUD16_06985 [Desulfobacterales bacterium]|nr:hypothetical protein [Desulfobacterales bacterium]
MIARPATLKCLTALLLAPLLLFSAAEAQAPQEAPAVWVVGSAPLQPGKTSAAREAAIANGLRQAVAAVAIEIASPGVFAEHFKTLNELLLDRPEEFIRGFKLLSETPSGKQHLVIIHATVAAGTLREAMTAAGVLGIKPAAAAAAVTLTVEGSGNLAHFVRLRRALAAIAGVTAVQVKEMKPNEAVLLVDFAGSGRELAAALALQTFDAFEVNVVEAVENASKVALTPK